jgi:hypothetical protein
MSGKDMEAQAPRLQSLATIFAAMRLASVVWAVNFFKFILFSQAKFYNFCSGSPIKFRRPQLETVHCVRTEAVDEEAKR